MNRKQRGFLRDTAKTAELLAISFEAEATSGGDAPLFVLLWRTLPFLPVSARRELEGLIRGAAADDCFEVSDWFDRIRRVYGRYSRVRTMCQILCCVWRAYRPGEEAADHFRRAAEVLRLLSAAVTAGVNTDRPPDLSAVWRAMIKHRRYLFGADPGARRRLLLGLECSVGSRRPDRPYRQLAREFLAADTEGLPDSAAELYLALGCAGAAKR